MISRFLLALTFLSLLGAPCVSFATTVNPQSSDLRVKIGESASATIVVTNNSTKEASYRVSFLSAEFGGDAEDLSLGTLNPLLSSGVIATPSLFTLAATEKKTVNISVTIPQEFSESAPTIAVLVTEGSAGNESGSVRTALTSLLFVHVASNDASNDSRVEIQNFSAIPGFSFGKPIVLSELAQNSGTDTLFVPNEVRVVNMFGREVDRFLLSNVPKHLPTGTSRSVSAKWPDGVQNFSPFVFGKYRFELWDGNTQYAVTNAWFFPVSSLGGAFIVIAVLLLGIIIFVRRRR
ncbi:MAG: hypothetical protein WC802_02435 [Patescibacteria group bacterium]|jgi:hypothetical protein